jgi:hypothetical protein
MQATLSVYLCDMKIKGADPIRLFPISSGQMILRGLLKVQTHLTSPISPSLILLTSFLKKLRQKLFCAGLDALGVFAQISGDVYCAAMASKAQESLMGEREAKRYLSGELRFLSVHYWSSDLHSRWLQLFERLLLRTLTTCHPSSSFSALLANNLTSHSHPGDLGITCVLRSFPIFWRLYLTIEVAGIEALKSQNFNTISKHLVNDDIHKRLTLLFRGDELTEQGNAEILMGRDVSLLQGSLRAKSLWLEPCLGDLILLHYRLEKLKKQSHPSKQDSEEEKGGGDGHEAELIMSQLRGALERRELTCRGIS